MDPARDREKRVQEFRWTTVWVARGMRVCAWRGVEEERDTAAEEKRRVSPFACSAPRFSPLHSCLQKRARVIAAQPLRLPHRPATRRGAAPGAAPAPGDLAAIATAAATKAIAAANAAQRAALRAASAADARPHDRTPSPSLGCDEAGGVALMSGGPSSPGSAAPPPAPSPLDPADAAAAAAATVSTRYPGREIQVRALAGARGMPGDWPRHVLVHGPPSMGKTAVVR